MENDEGFVIYDRYDLWQWTPGVGNIPVKITNGRDQKMIHRYIRTNPEVDFLTKNSQWLMHVTDDKTKSSGYAWYTPTTHTITPIKTEAFEYSRQVMKARDKEVYLFTKENFSVFPDLRISNDGFVSSKKISDANPQQKEYKWGTIELYEWVDFDSVRHQGLLVKPAGFDPLRSYPTIVNFYEKSTQALHVHPTIEPHRSTINYAFYASRGYVIFNPDISYKIGYPGESAYEIVMSGVQSLVKNRIADPNNLALQGHSWGGYQIAYIVTRTDVFKCAEAGASVVNMTSAYGGIRWGTGLSRMFQYEQEQSRIGRTLWEDPQKYIANSPLFKINKITTPLLLLHNDEDAAVPFEQGIEFYLALRRLGKVAWLLNYRGEPHWPVKWQNRKDFQLRMSQFFDYYLQGKPEPRWMSEGVPALKRGIDPGY
ncbi:MAG: prolyl oligopeptidase family serine peptidase [Bacteroidota bacterium]|nr:prolyl oligopeptidase family serine peptidase [Bacteroidota bacterium]